MLLAAFSGFSSTAKLRSTSRNCAGLDLLNARYRTELTPEPVRLPEQPAKLDKGLAWFNFDNVVLRVLIEAIVVEAKIIFLRASDLLIYFSDDEGDCFVGGVFESKRYFDGFADNPPVRILRRYNFKSLRISPETYSNQYYQQQDLQHRSREEFYKS